MTYYFRYYKDIAESLKKPSMKEYEDYVTFLEYNTDTKELGYYWFTTKKIGGKASTESIMEDYGWKEDWEHIIAYKNDVYNDVKEKGFAAIEDFMKWSSKVNCFQWVEEE